MTGKLLAPDFKRIGRPDVAPASDAFPQALVDGTPEKLKADLIAPLGKDRVMYRALDLVRYASDASAYRLLPKVIVLPRTADEIAKILPTVARTIAMRRFAQRERASMAKRSPTTFGSTCAAIGMA